MKKILIFIFVVCVMVASFFVLPKKTASPVQTTNKAVSATPTKKILSDHFVYQGQNGKDALTLLVNQLHASIEKDKSGMIVSINGRKADAFRHEYWGFFVNGKLAPVGAEDYITKKGEVIEWRIEKY